jgi:hypothetical protein
MYRLKTQVLVQFKLEVVLYDSIWVDASIVALAMSLLLRAAISWVVASPDNLIQLAIPDIFAHK